MDHISARACVYNVYTHTVITYLGGPNQGRQFVLKSGGDKDQMKKHYSRTGKFLNNGASKMGIA